MKIIEGMKELKLIEKKISDNAVQIQSLCCRLSNEMPKCNSDDEQRKKVKELIQSSEDLVKRYLKIKRDIEYTNIVTNIQYGGKDMSISELLVMKRKLISIHSFTFTSLNTTAMETEARKTNAGTRAAGDITVVRFFDESEKNEKLSLLQDMKYNLDSRLEVVNAMTDIKEAPVE